MHVLSVIHGTDARAELFAPVVEEAGHRLDEWSFGWGTPPPRPLDAYDSVLVFGGAMHADQDHHHPWLREETLWLQQLLDRHTPVLGVCLGVQLLARASGARVERIADGPEIGWHRVELTDAGLDVPRDRRRSGLVESASALAAARDTGSTRATSRRSCARRSRRCGARASRARNASQSGSTPRPRLRRAHRRARGSRPARAAAPAP